MSGFEYSFHLPGPLALFLLLAWSSPAGAAGRSRAVVDLTGTDDAATVTSRLEESFGAGFSAQVVQLQDLSDPGTAPWLVSPPGRLEPCAATSGAADDLAARLQAAEAAIDGLDYAAALTDLRQLDADVCATSAPIDPAAQLRIPYLTGIAEFYADDRDAARGSFRQAAALVDKLEWDTAFSPEPQQVFLLGVGDAIQAPTATLHIDGRERPDELWLDGTAVASDVDEIVVREGRHLLQIRDGEGSLRGMVLTVDGAGTAHLMGPDGLDEGLRAEPDDDAGAPAFAVVAAGAEAHGYTEVVVLADPAWDRCWWFNVIDGVWKPITLTAGARLRAARNHRAAGGVLTGTGGALLVGGSVLALAQVAAMEDLRPQMETHASAYALHIDEYEAHRTRAAVGIGLLAAGAATLTTGLLLMARGKAIQAETDVDPRLTVIATPDGAWLSFHTTF